MKACDDGDGGHNSGGLEKDANRRVRPDTRHHRTFLSRTSDFRSFTDAKVFFSPGRSEIDACMAFDDRGSANPAEGRWVLAVKDEQIPELGGKNIRPTTAPADLTNLFPPKFRSLSDPNKPWTDPVAGPGSSVQPTQWVEGPTLLKVDGEWRLYFDKFRLRTNRFALATSTDLIHWTDRTAEVQMPLEAHHGTIFLAPRAIVLKAFPRQRTRLFGVPRSRIFFLGRLKAELRTVLSQPIHASSNSASRGRADNGWQRRGRRPWRWPFSRWT